MRLTIGEGKYTSKPDGHEAYPVESIDLWGSRLPGLI